MTSAKQIYNIIEYTFSGENNNIVNPDFVEPTATFSVTPVLFSLDNPPANLTAAGAITPNSASNITWEVYDGVSVSPILSGSGTVVSGIIKTPTADTTYQLKIMYSGGNEELSVYSTVDTYEDTLIGQLPAPGIILVTADNLTPYEAGLTHISESESKSFFEINASATGRIVIVVPNSYGTLLDIADENDNSALNEFTTINDVGNDRIIYSKIDTVTTGRYKYKLIY